MSLEQLEKLEVQERSGRVLSADELWREHLRGLAAGKLEGRIIEDIALPASIWTAVLFSKILGLTPEELESLLKSEAEGLTP